MMMLAVWFHAVEIPVVSKCADIRAVEINSITLVPIPDVNHHWYQRAQVC